MASQQLDDTQPGFAAADGAAPQPEAGPSRRPWARVLAWLGTRWRARPGHRPAQRELARLGDYLLRDIGVDPDTVRREPMPPTWDQWRG